MKLYLVRHGQTEYNASSMHHYDHIGLSELGIRQAEKLVKRFSKIPIDVIYSSNLERAKHTATIINKTVNKDILYSDILNEIKNPSEVIGKSRESVEVKKVHSIIAQNHHDPAWHYSDEENFSEFEGRVGQFFNLLNSMSDVNNILAVTHGGPIRIMVLSILLGEELTPEIFHKFKTSQKISNGGITICEKESSRNWTIKTLNDCSHLDEKS